MALTEQVEKNNKRRNMVSPSMVNALLGHNEEGPRWNNMPSDVEPVVDLLKLDRFFAEQVSALYKCCYPIESYENKGGETKGGETKRP